MINNIDPVKYSKTRNFIDGAVLQNYPLYFPWILYTSANKTSNPSKGYKPVTRLKILQELTMAGILSAGVGSKRQ